MCVCARVCKNKMFNKIGVRCAVSASRCLVYWPCLFVFAVLLKENTLFVLSGQRRYACSHSACERHFIILNLLLQVVVCVLEIWNNFAYLSTVGVLYLYCNTCKTLLHESLYILYVLIFVLKTSRHNFSQILQIHK